MRIIQKRYEGYMINHNVQQKCRKFSDEQELIIGISKQFLTTIIFFSVVKFCARYYLTFENKILIHVISAHIMLKLIYMKYVLFRILYLSRQAKILTNAC